MFRFHKTRGNLWLPQQLSDCHVCSTRFELLEAVSAVTVVVLIVVGVVGRHVKFRRNLLPPSSEKEK